MDRPKWKSKLFDELHKIREEMTKELKDKSENLFSVVGTEQRLQKNGYQYLKCSKKYRIVKKI